jgi:hypothetical protein
MAAPSTPRYRLPYADPEGALLRLDTIIFGGWAPNLDGMVAATRTFAWHGGFNADGSLTADGTIVIPDSSTKYVQRTYAGAVSADAALDLASKIPMAVVTAAGGLLAHFEDIREIGLWSARARILALYGGAEGDTVYSHSGVPTILSVGAAPDGYVLSLAGGLPAWAAAAGGGGSASLFSKTVLQLHFDGTNGSTAFTDAAKGRTVTVTGATAISTAQSKFGGASGLFGGASGAGLSIPSHNDFFLGTLFMIEGFIMTTQVSRQYATIMERDNGSFSSGSWALIFNSGTSSDGKVSYFNQNADPSVAELTSVSAINDGAWHHIRVMAFGGLIMLAIDGVIEAIKGWTFAPSQPSAALLIGRSVYATRELSAYLDEWRIVRGGVAETVSGFTPPSSAFPDS